MRENVNILSKEQIFEKLKKLPGWIYANNKISKQFQFASFSDGVQFINKLTPFCNKIDHHPDIHIYYKKITFELTRYSVGNKVTNKDIVVAKEIERLYHKMYPDK
jgi:4a-hydroxytetrahydrobiopterin dehydratase